MGAALSGSGEDKPIDLLTSPAAWPMVLAARVRSVSEVALESGMDHITAFGLPSTLQKLG